MKVDVIIPVYKPGKELIELIEKLEAQTVGVHKIILMNTEKPYLDAIMDETEFCKEHKTVEIHHLSKEEFDHGGTRCVGVAHSHSDTFIMMTQDAMPADEHLVEKLTDMLWNEQEAVQNSQNKDSLVCAAVYARQLPKQDCSVTERYVRQFNYPHESRMKGKADLEQLGIKTFFCSNVCAAYKRDIYEKLGGFTTHTIFNEDMIFAAGAVKAGYLIGYAANAEVVHSHNYTGVQQFHRNFDLGVSHAQYPEVFSGVPAEGEGMKMVLHTIRYLWQNRYLSKILPFVWQSGCKYIGYLLGKHYTCLPGRLVICCSDNKKYWQSFS